MAQITKVSYLYRDASNYKFRGEFGLLGQLGFRELSEHLFDNEFFVPEKLGIPALRPSATTDDDHLLHSVEGCSIEDGSEFIMTANEFRDRVIRASERGWFY